MLLRFVLVAAIVFSASAADFSLLRVHAPRADNPGEVTISTEGDPPPDSELHDASNWMLTAINRKLKQRRKVPLGKDSIAYEKSTAAVTMKFDASIVSGWDRDDIIWKVIYEGDLVAASPLAPPKKEAAFSAAKSKDLSDLYLAGAYTAGVGSKPLIILDAKGTYGWAFDKARLWKAGFYGDLSINASADTSVPNNRTQADPDSIRAYGQIDGIIPLQSKPFAAIIPVIRPLGGEFAREYSTSNLMTAGHVTFLSYPLGNFVLDPMIGYEIGKNLNKPSNLFGVPVDLSKWDAIRRLVFGANANYYVFAKHASADDIYRFVISGSWQARTIFTDEPFVTYQYIPIDGVIYRAQVLELRRNTRHFVEAGVTWNATPLFGVQVQYKYGSLPPVFELINHQVSLGLVFKAKYKDRPVPR